MSGRHVTTLVPCDRWAGGAGVTRVARPAVLVTMLPVVFLLLLLSAGPAAGHAAGVPPHARLGAEAERVQIEWTAAADEAADVGVSVGIFGEEVVEALLGGPAEHLPTEEQIQALSGSSALRDYLLDNVRVTQDGQRCDGEVEPAPDFLSEGAAFTFICPEEVDQAHVAITILHDRDARYRTFGVDGSLQTTVHTVDAPEHLWDFTAAAEAPVDTAGPPIGVLAAGFIVLGALGLTLHRLRPARTSRRRR
jgi:hypothetical protein